MILHGGLHLTPKAHAWSLEGFDLPRVLRLRFRLVVFESAGAGGGGGVAGLAGVVSRVVLLAVLILATSLGRLIGVSSGGSLGGGWSSPSCCVLGGGASPATAWTLHGAGFLKERVRNVRLRLPSKKSSISPLLVGVM